MNATASTSFKASGKPYRVLNTPLNLKERSASNEPITNTVKSFEDTRNGNLGYVMFLPSQPATVATISSNAT